MEKHTCKLCNRSFSNGRALGGHMRSHVVASSKSHLVDYSSSSTSSPEAAEAKGLCYGLRENPKRSFRLADPEFSSSVTLDRESETESSPVAINRRRRPTKRGLLEFLEAEQLSSVSDATPEEHVAISLMLLSRDVWLKDEAEDESQPSPFPANPSSGFQCDTCQKSFRSYQALGGHRASHKKLKSCLPLPQPPNAAAITEAKSPHICPICFRKFSCGQALGGHKRSHLSSKPPQKLFDLNLPAPLEDAPEISAVSEAILQVESCSF